MVLMDEAGSEPPGPDDAADADRFRRAFERIDAAHAADPAVVLVDGAPVPAELLYARRMSQWLRRLEPGASAALRLATRCQHLRRWEIPRDTYPMTRPGYLQWRTRLATVQAERAAEILRDIGYDEATVACVGALLRKEGLKSNPETQTLEDVICLVFLENYFAGFAPRHDEEKVIGILRKTWRKMSDRGREVALTLEMPEPARAWPSRNEMPLAASSMRAGCSSRDDRAASSRGATATRITG